MINNAMLIKWIGRLLIIGLCILLPQPAQCATAGSFPAVPYNSLSFPSFSLSGAVVDSAVKDEANLNWKGRLENGGTLRIAGTARRAGGWGPGNLSGRLRVSVYVEGAPENKFSYDLFGNDQTVPFDVYVKIPPGATHGRVTVELSGRYSMGGGSRAISLRGEFSGPAISASQPAKPAEPTNDWFSNDWTRPLGDAPEGARGFIAGIDGSGSVYLSDRPGDPDGSIETRKWRKIRQGEKVWFYQGAMLSTSDNASVRIIWDSGARMRSTGGTVIELDRESRPTEAGVVASRLWKGLVDFYFPSNAAATKRFDIETVRCNTSIKGTELTVKEQSASTTINVHQGTVEVTGKGKQQPVLVGAGKSLTFSDSPHGGSTAIIAPWIRTLRINEINQWHGTWKRRAATNEFEAHWRNAAGAEATDVLVLEAVNGQDLIFWRVKHGGRYFAKLSSDGKKLRGGATWYAPGWYWTGIVE